MLVRRRMGMLWKVSRRLSELRALRQHDLCLRPSCAAYRARTRNLLCRLVRRRVRLTRIRRTRIGFTAARLRLQKMQLGTLSDDTAASQKIFDTATSYCTPSNYPNVYSIYLHMKCPGMARERTILAWSNNVTLPRREPWLPARSHDSPHPSHLCTTYYSVARYLHLDLVVPP